MNLGSYYLEVNGTLQAIGGADNPVTFNGGNGGYITFTQYSTNWTQSTRAGSTIQNSIINAQQDFIIISDCSPEISGNTIALSGLGTYNVIDVSGGAPVIANNTISSPYNGISLGGSIFPFVAPCNAIVANNTIYGVNLNFPLSGTGSGITVNPTTYSESAVIEGNLIVNFGNAVELDEVSGSGTYLIQNNTLINNLVGVDISGHGTTSAQSFANTILYNNLLSNSQYNIYLTPEATTGNVNAADNYWGTVNTQAINQTIYDFKDDFNLGTVTFAPFLTAPAQAPTYINATASTGGSINPSGYVSLNYGGSQAFTITPSSGYYVASVLVNGSPVGTVNTYTIQNINGATTISAAFAPNPTPTSSPTPSPTPSPTSSPTTQPTSTPTSTPTNSPTMSPSSSPSVPELSWLAIILLFLAVVSAAGMARHRRQVKKP